MSAPSASVNAEPPNVVRDQWEDFFRGIVASLHYMENGFTEEQEELALGLCCDYTAQSVLTSYLTDRDWLADLSEFTSVRFESLNELPPPVSVPRPTVNILVSDSGMAMISGGKKTLQKHTVEASLRQSKPNNVDEIIHEMMWGQTLQTLVKRAVALVKEVQGRKPDAKIHVIVYWNGNELVGPGGIQDETKHPFRQGDGEWDDVMSNTMRHLTWYATQCKKLNVAQAAVMGEPDADVYLLGGGGYSPYETFMKRTGEWVMEELAKDMPGKIRWIKSKELCRQIELKDQYHPVKSDENQHILTMYPIMLFHVLDIVDRIIEVVPSARVLPRRDIATIDPSPMQGAGASPFYRQKMMKAIENIAVKKKKAPLVSSSFSKEEVQREQPDAEVPVSPEDFGKLAEEPAEPPSREEEEEQMQEVPAAVTSEPSPSIPRRPVEYTTEKGGVIKLKMPERARGEEVEETPRQAPKAKAAPPSSGRARDYGPMATVPAHITGHVDEFRYAMQKDINGTMAEHVITDNHAYELVHRTGWESDAKYARFQPVFKDFLPKLSMLLRGRDSDSTLAFDKDMFVDVDEFAREILSRYGARIKKVTVEDLVAIAFKDKKCRFEFKGAAGFHGLNPPQKDGVSGLSKSALPKDTPSSSSATATPTSMPSSCTRPRTCQGMWLLPSLASLWHPLRKRLSKCITAQSGHTGSGSSKVVLLPEAQKSRTLARRMCICLTSSWRTRSIPKRIETLGTGADHDRLQGSNQCWPHLLQDKSRWNPHHWHGAEQIHHCHWGHWEEQGAMDQGGHWCPEVAWWSGRWREGSWICHCHKWACPRIAAEFKGQRQEEGIYDLYATFDPYIKGSCKSSRLRWRAVNTNKKGHHWGQKAERRCVRKCLPELLLIYCPRASRMWRLWCAFD